MVAGTHTSGGAGCAPCTCAHKREAVYDGATGPRVHARSTRGSIPQEGDLPVLLSEPYVIRMRCPL